MNSTVVDAVLNETRPTDAARSVLGGTLMLGDETLASFNATKQVRGALEEGLKKGFGKGLNKGLEKGSNEGPACLSGRLAPSLTHPTPQHTPRSTLPTH